MKKYFYFVLLGFFLAATCIVYVPRTYDEAPPPEREYYEEEYSGYSSRLDVSYFYDYLSSYGSWAYYPPHRYVWIPRVIIYRWRPYTQGSWIWTDYGWTWVSLFEWGWAPFHYGRWSWSNDLGWYWVPDVVWGPAWVTWRRSDLYLGWAPLPPAANFVIGVGITSLPFSLPGNFWVFVEGRYFLSSYLHRYILPFERNVTIINYTVVRTNIIVRDRRVINSGIDINHIRRVTRQKISKYELMEVNKPAASKIRVGKVEVYKPSLRKSQKAKPKKVLDKREAKDKISEITIRKTEKKVNLEDVHKREERLLEESQQKEMKVLERNYEEKKETAKSSSEAEKIEEEYKAKVVKLKKSHDKEKAKIKERHKKEEKKVKKTKIKKKEKK